MKNNSIKTKALSMASKVAFHEARKSANTSCPLFAYQPQIPEAVKKLRKF
nr:cyclic lactone autoinducer peptide [uncultured Caproiciproducens sp.]